MELKKNPKPVKVINKSSKIFTLQTIATNKFNQSCHVSSSFFFFYFIHFTIALGLSLSLPVSQSPFHSFLIVFYSSSLRSHYYCYTFILQLICATWPLWLSQCHGNISNSIAYYILHIHTSCFIFPLYCRMK